MSKLSAERVRFWLGEVRSFEAECRHVGKVRTSNSALGVVPMADRDMAQAVECATVEALGGKPDLRVRRGNDGKVDGVLMGSTFDVKASIVHTSWDGIRGFNDADSQDGRVAADFIVCALATRALDRAEILGYAPRGAAMKMLPGFTRPAYPRSELIDISYFVVDAGLREAA